jgi:hypothetical protein
MVTSIRPDSTTGDARFLDHFRSYVTNVSAAKARDILETRNWGRQRNLNTRWVEMLRMAMLKRELTFLTLAYAELPDGRQYLIDGQHRLAALSQIDGYVLPAQVTVHRVNDEAALGALYLTYDRPKTRTPDVGLRAMGVFEETEAPEQFVKRMGPSALIVESGFSRSVRTRGNSLVERSQIVQSWLPEIGRYHDLLLGTDAPRESKRTLLRAAVGSVALATLRDQPASAEMFWSRLASQEMLAADDPRRTLMNWLRATTLTTRGRNGMSEITYCLYVVGAWNAFFEGRSLKLLKVVDTKSAVRLGGTRFTGSAQ